MTPLEQIRHDVKVIKEMSEHSKSMSIGAKIIITRSAESILKNCEALELELMYKK